MKRHPSLQDLSREHHLILLHARELRWATRGHGDLQKAYREFLGYWRKRGMRHLQNEEDKLFPYCERCSGWKKTEAVDVIFKQHREIESLITQLEGYLKAGRDLMPVSSALSELLDRHVRYEERVVFEEIQEALTGEELEGLVKYLKT